MYENSVIDETKLARLADVAIHVGLRLEPKQNLLMTASVEALPFVRLLTQAAYKAGAGVVTTLFSDDELTLAKYKYGHEESFGTVASWLYGGIAEAFSENTARLGVITANPFLLSEQDPQRVAQEGRATSQVYKPALERISNFDINWNLVAYPNQVWAQQVFPDCSPQEAVKKLSEAIFAASRVDVDDPISAWEEHNRALQKRSDWLNDKRFAALHFKGPQTDLTVGLADGHAWTGGANKAKNGITCNPNIPTEEVFTTPHALRVDGTVSSTKPLSHQGTLIDDIVVRFEGGKIVDVQASRGEDVLKRILDTDEGARRLGEVALVPHSSPISKSGILFYNTLFDENAASHIALGQCYSECFVDNAKLTKEQIIAQGGNQSLIHIDWMIGSDQIDIDGLDAQGQRTAVMRKGEWAYS